MNVPVLGHAIDERFLKHRFRSTSAGGLAGGLVAIGLFAWRYYVDHLWSWDLFAVAAAIAGVKVAVMIWYQSTD